MVTTNEKMLEHNVHELTKQLYSAYKRITEQKSEIRSLKIVVDALSAWQVDKSN